MTGALFDGLRRWVGCAFASGALPLVMASTTLATPAPAIIYDNGLRGDERVIFADNFNFMVCGCASASASFSNPARPYQVLVADDFELASGNPWAVTGAEWTGVILDTLGDELVDSEPAWGFEITFDLLFFESTPGQFGVPVGNPAEPLPGSAIAHRQVTVSGEQIFPGAIDSVALNEAGYRASFEPVLLDGGVNHWFSVVAQGDFSLVSDGNTGTAWAWWGRILTGNGAQGGTDLPSWEGRGRQQVFTLSGYIPVPEPNAALLLLLAVGAGAVLRSGRSSS